MAIQVTSTALGDITSSIHLDSLRIANRASRRTAVLDFDYLGASLMTPEDEIQVYDGATRVFRGKVRNRKRADTGPGPGRRRVQRITCQDTTTYLADDVIDGTLVLVAGQSDQAMIQAVVAYSTKGITAAAPYNQVVKASMPEVDVSNLNLYDALAAITKASGASFYVDDSLRVHNYTAESTVAPFTLVDSAANGSTRVGYVGLVLPDETFDLVNAVWAIGGSGTTPEWRPPTGTWPTASHTAYGRRERAVTWADIHGQVELQTVADAYLAGHDTPATPISLTVYQAGLKAGQLATFESDLWAVNTTLPVVEVITAVIPGTKGLQYDVTLGDIQDDIGDLVNSAQEAAAEAVQVAQDVADSAGVDSTPPAQVTGLALATGLTQDQDGGLSPYIEASWNANGDADLEAYELEVDAAIQGQVPFSAVAYGYGGTLGAGTYTVAVTGLGTVAGESASVAPQQVDIAAGQRLGVTITATAGLGPFRIYAERVDTPHLALTTSTTGSQVEVTTEGTVGDTPPATSTAVDFAIPQAFRTNGLKVLVSPVQGGVWHQARAKAVDKAGNRSMSWSALASVQAARDTTAPAVPQGLAAVPGYRLVGLTWNRNTEADLDRYEVRYYQGAAPPANVNDWTRLVVRATVLVIGGLTADVPYLFQVRAVDRSNNVRTSEAVATAVDADDNLEAGWSNTALGTYVTATPNLVGAADLAVNSVVTQLLNAGTISATAIQGGSLAVGGLAGATTQVAVYDSQGRLAGLWANNGLTVYDPANSSNLIRLASGAVQFSDDGGSTWSTAMDARGITADSILLGSLTGGPNSVPNAGMELTAFSSLFTTLWDVGADWDADIQVASTINIASTANTGDLKLVTFA